jgi:hypothetical protein
MLNLLKKMFSFFKWPRLVFCYKIFVRENTFDKIFKIIYSNLWEHDFEFKVQNISF